MKNYSRKMKKIGYLHQRKNAIMKRELFGGKKLFFALLLVLITSFQLYAQQEDGVDAEDAQEEATAPQKADTKDNKNKPEMSAKDRIVFGGDFGLSFGVNSGIINISPLIGYRITDRMTVGGGFTYLYMRGRLAGYSTSNIIGSYTMYGPRAYARLGVTESLFAHCELEYLNLPYRKSTTGESLRGWVPMLWLGGGYRVPIGERSAFLLYVTYNVLHASSYPRNDGIIYSPYGNNPILIRTGFVF
jgi:hypothetical protein